jgi:L-asparagine transporter-like permease
MVKIDKLLEKIGLIYTVIMTLNFVIHIFPQVDEFVEKNKWAYQFETIITSILGNVLLILYFIHSILKHRKVKQMGYAKGHEFAYYIRLILNPLIFLFLILFVLFLFLSQTIHYPIVISLGICLIIYFINYKINQSFFIDLNRKV